LGIVEFNGSKKNQFILSGEAANTLVPFGDSNPHCKPEEQYRALAVCSIPVRGLYAFASPDGVHWRRMGREPLITKGKFDSQNLAFWDSVRGCYVAYFRDMRGPNDEFGLKGLQLGLDDNDSMVGSIPQPSFERSSLCRLFDQQGRRGCHGHRLA